MNVTLASPIDSEPTVGMFDECLRQARRQPVDGVIGLGGGSAMDMAKLVAALVDSAQSIHDVFGSNLLRGRDIFLACLPTTSGTGSEVSPNAIFLDEACQLKKAVISPHLVPDVACVDPLLTCSVPPAVTAATGLDALTHCIEAYANRFAHPMVDLYALQGVRLISEHLLAAIADGRNTEARANLALGSLYGGLCLGPVNTAAVHALAYSLGSEFHVAHGVSNAVLLPYVLRFNLEAAPERYANIAVALGVEPANSAVATAERGIEKLTGLVGRCPMPQRIADFGVPKAALPHLAKAAMTVTRLLKNNPRTVTEADALNIYLSAY
jgi:alcohol dehydrogenase class IV